MKYRPFFNGTWLSCTPESKHSRRMSLKSCSLMQLDNIGLCIYRKKNIGCKEQHPAGMCLKMSPPSHESTVEQKGMTVPGGYRDLIIKAASGAITYRKSAQQPALHHPLLALVSFEFNRQWNRKWCYVIISSQAN